MIEHCCGASGFGYSIYDECPGCQDDWKKWRKEARERIVAALQTFDLQMQIARAARCSLPDVKDWLEGK